MIGDVALNPVIERKMSEDSDRANRQCEHIHSSMPKTLCQKIEGMFMNSSYVDQVQKDVAALWNGETVDVPIEECEKLHELLQGCIRILGNGSVPGSQLLQAAYDEEPLVYEKIPAEDQLLKYFMAMKWVSRGGLISSHDYNLLTELGKNGYVTEPVPYGDAYMVSAQDGLLCMDLSGWVVQMIKVD